MGEERKKARANVGGEGCGKVREGRKRTERGREKRGKEGWQKEIKGEVEESVRGKKKKQGGGEVGEKKRDKKT